MRIGIDAHPLSRLHTVVPRILGNVIPELQRIDRENDYYLYSDRDFHVGVENPRWRKRVRSRCAFLPGTFWLQTEGKRMIAEDGLDVFWATGHVLPSGLGSSVATVILVCDLVWRLYPATMGYFNRIVHWLFAERSVREADMIITISDSTRRDLEAMLGVSPKKIRVIYPAVSAPYDRLQPAAAAGYIARKYHVSESYICTVGTIEPRKNLATLVDTVRILRDRGALRHQFLIAGAAGWRDSKIYEKAKRLGLTDREVRFLGYVAEEDLPFFYSGASLFLFPSLYEGFGLPLVEAMACGVPIVASDTSSIPEVVQGAAILASPDRPEDFADAVTRVTTDRDLRDEMIKKGLERARCFRWDQTASQILEVLKEVSQSGHEKRPADGAFDKPTGGPAWD